MVNRIHVTRDFGLDLRLGGGYALRVPSGSVYVDGEDQLSLGESISSGISMKAETALFFTLKEQSGTSIEMLLGLSLFTENDYNGYVLPHLSTIAGLMFLHEQGALE